MIGQEEIAKRQTPRMGETWQFSNGVVATIAEAGDDVPHPEIAFTDAHQFFTEGRTGFKFNSTRDPLPVRRL